MRNTAILDEILDSYNEDQNVQSGFKEDDDEYGYNDIDLRELIREVIEYAEEPEELDEEPDWATINGLKFVERDGGGEGGSEYCYCVFGWKNKFYKAEYSYYSHHGYDFDNVSCYEVKPVEKLMTIYEKVS